MKPLATNILNSLGTFIQRETYSEKIYPKSSADPIDLWYSKSLYGKINKREDIIYLSEAFLKQIKTDEKEPKFALNFVVDAFDDLRKFYDRSASKINSESILDKVECKNAWQSSTSNYHKYMNILYKVFVSSYLNDNNRENKIKDFKSFVIVFLEFIDIISEAYPITRSQFIKSKFCSPLISGLMIEVFDENHAIDENKYEKFIQDPNFDFYSKAARQYGFYIDKNAPWRLVADISSPAMKPYIKKYLSDHNKIFKDFYYEAYKSDIETLKIYLTQFYNSFVKTNPFIYEAKHSVIKNKTLNTILERKPLNTNNFFDFKFWFRLYLYIRLKEEKAFISQIHFENILSNTNILHMSLDNKKALEYINIKIKQSNTSKDILIKNFSF